MVVYHERIQIGFKMSSKREAQRILAQPHMRHICRFLKECWIFMTEILGAGRVRIRVLML